MTRINTLPVYRMTTRHLIAERYEMLRVFSLAAKAEKRGCTANMYDTGEYTFGKGHVTFFYNKLGFLTKRYFKITKELDKRGIKVNSKDKVPYTSTPKGIDWYGDWKPTKEAIRLCRERVNERIASKPHLYQDAKQVLKNTKRARK